MWPEKIIVVGKNSVIGRCYCRHATQKGYVLEALASTDCDFSNEKAVRSFFYKQKDLKCAIVFFAAINRRVKNDYDSFIGNIQMIRNLLQTVQQSDISSMVYFSSTDVYGLAPVTPVTEQSGINPESYYSLAKAVCEKMLLTEAKFPVTVLRIPGAYAMPRDVHGAIGKLIRKALTKDPIILSNEGKTLRDYVHVEDINRAIDLLLEKPHHGALNFATGKSVSLKEMVKIIEEESGEKTKVTYETEANERDFNLVFDSSLFMNLFPHFHFTDLRKGIKNYIQHEKETALHE
jgi:UDP-glucose 4-epimerase